MRILKVIHGYPPLYSAGSEVYSQTLCRTLAQHHEMHVFTREEDVFRPDGDLREESDNGGLGGSSVALHIVNAARVGINYRNAAVESRFAELADKLRPDIVHIGHLSHLSLGIAEEAARREIPVVHTLHDFWLMCLRGQFIQVASDDSGEPWPLCDGQENHKCARRCLSRFFTGAESRREVDEDYWADRVAARMDATKRAIELADRLVAPSRFLLGKFRDEFHVPSSKLMYLDYGFDRVRLSGRRRMVGEPFVFGYIGTHVPGKGVGHLLRAFAMLKGDSLLRIWGRLRTETASLRALADSLPTDVRRRIEWMDEYDNERIVAEVFNRADAIVVPSVWPENSPLVIHEAQQAGIPVIAAAMGGMAEYVSHEVNGLLFAPRDATALFEQMRRLAENPDWACELGARGYLYSDDGQVPEIGEHAAAIENIYRQILKERDAARVKILPAPWRVTFDTNPDHCNFRCVMCEEHSPHSKLQVIRRMEKRPRRMMSFELISRVVRSLAPKGLREIIPSTMGEPLLYKDFERVIELCREEGVMMNLTTNGSFPRLGVRRWAELLVPVTSDVKISWNGASRETYEKIMLKGDWDSALENIREFAHVRDAHAESGGNRCRLTLQATFMESTVGELPDLVRLAASLGADRIKGHHLWAHFQEIKNQDMRRSRDSIDRWNTIVEKTRRAAAESKTPDGRTVLLENIEPLSESDSAAGGKCPFLGGEAWVSATGRFDPCCAPDSERRTLGNIGNLQDSDIAAIWNSDEYRLLTASYRSREVCLKCNMRGT